MRIIRDAAACPPEFKGAAVALGNFDGVHPGHQAILKECIAIAKAENIPAAAMTFEPHPREFFSRDKQKLRLTPFRYKAQCLKELGIEALFVLRFNRALASLSAEAFVREILVRDLNVRHIITGYNFAFGKGRAGNISFLAEMAKKCGFGFTACPPVKDTSEPVSSSAIRQALTKGDVKKANNLLGRPYSIEGRVRRGQQRGKALGFPTANISVAPLFKPRLGIYAVKIAVGNEEQWHKAVASLGVNPTFGLEAPVLEVHGLGMARDLYGQRLRVEFVEFLRDEEKFGSIEALQKQMEADCMKAKEVLRASQ